LYKSKIDDKDKLIVQQQNQLLDFKAKLKQQIEEKTTNLLELNESLEIKVQEKVDELMQKDKLLTAQSKQAVMGEMISMIAHQWRQPLSTITLYISNLKVKKLLGKPVSEEETYKTLDKISDMSIYLSETIDDFKTFFQPDKELGEIDIYMLLDRAIGFTMPRIKEFQIEIVIKNDEQIMITTYINELVQVILNLLNNSVDALSNINKENKKIIFDVKEVEDKLFIYVNDNANGISDENLSRIFEPYFSTKGSNGTGLGLYMSQMILQKQFSGDIRVETSKEGSTFVVEISKNLI
jgi:C4-dicarboxylate-specific signal transduction histidine kinase